MTKSESPNVTIYQHLSYLSSFDSKKPQIPYFKASVTALDDGKFPKPIFSSGPMQPASDGPCSLAFRGKERKPSKRFPWQILIIFALGHSDCASRILRL